MICGMVGQGPTLLKIALDVRSWSALIIEVKWTGSGMAIGIRKRHLPIRSHINGSHGNPQGAAPNPVEISRYLTGDLRGALASSERSESRVPGMNPMQRTYPLVHNAAS